MTPKDNMPVGSSRKLFIFTTIRTLIIESPLTQERVSTGVHEALDDPSVVQTKVFKKG